MPDPETFTIEEAQRHFARSLNGRTWELLGLPKRSPEQGELMLLAAQASLYHWLQIGTAVHAQRGHWLVAHVYAVLEQAAPAMQHAQRCAALTAQHPAEMQDFDRAYALEALARAYALQGEIERARAYYGQAASAGEAIADAEDRQIFTSDLQSGKWYGAV